VTFSKALSKTSVGARLTGVCFGLARRFGAHTPTDHACSYFSISVLRIFLDSPHFFCRNDSSSNLAQSLPAGLNFCSKRTCVSSGIQFTRHFIEFVVVEMKQIVSSNSNVILTRQTNGQRSGMAAVGKRRALAFYFLVRICYMFCISKCRG